MNIRLFTALFFLSSSCFASLYAINLSGNYLCKGHEVDTHSPFICTMNLQKTGETFQGISQCNDGTSYRGTGIFDERAQRFSAVFINLKNANETGICMAVVNPDGSLRSTWTYLDKTTTAQTVCVKNKRKP